MAVINKSASIGSSLTLRATPNRGYEFDHWSDLEASSSDYSNTNRTYIVKSSGNSLEAIFRNKDLGDITAIEGDGYEVVSSPGGSFIDIVPKHPIYGNTQVTINFDQNKEWYNRLVSNGEWVNDIEITTDKYTPTINIPANVLEDLLYNGGYVEMAFTDRFGRSVGLNIDQPRGSRIHIINNTGLPNGSIKILNNTNEVRIDWNGNRSYSIVPEGANTLVVEGDDIQHNAGRFLSGSNPFTMNVSHKIPYEFTLTRGIYHNISIFWPTGGLEYSYNGTPYVISYDSRVKQGSNLYVSLSQNMSDGPTDTGYVKQLAIKVGDKIYGNSIPNITSEVSGLAYLADSLTIDDAYILSPWGDVHTGEILHNAAYGTLPSIEIVDSQPTQGNGKWQVYIDPQDGKKFKGWLVRDPMMGPDQEVEGENSFPNAGTIRPWFEDRKVLSFIDNNCFFKDQVLNSFNEVEYKAYHTSYPNFNGDAPGLVISSYGPALWPSLTDIDTYLSNWQIDGRDARIVSTTEGDVRDAMATQTGDIFVYDTRTPYPCRTFVFKTEGTYKPIADDQPKEQFQFIAGSEYIAPISEIEASEVTMYFWDTEVNPAFGALLKPNEFIIPYPYTDLGGHWNLDYLMSEFTPNGVRQMGLVATNDGGVESQARPELIEDSNGRYVKFTLTDGGIYTVETYLLNGYRHYSGRSFDYYPLLHTSVNAESVSANTYRIDISNICSELVNRYNVADHSIYVTVNGAFTNKDSIMVDVSHGMQLVTIHHDLGVLNLNIGKSFVASPEVDEVQYNELLSPAYDGIYKDSFIVVLQ